MAVAHKAALTQTAVAVVPTSAGLMGVVKSYNGAKGFGFITVESGNDVFFSRNELPADAREVRGSFLEGRTVTFDAGEGPDGRPKATSVQIPFIEGHPLAGSIKSYSEKNGYGFITCSSLPDDVRFLQKDLPVQAPGARLQGELVTFHVQARPDGKLQVSKLQFQTAKIAERLQGQAMAGAGYSLAPQVFGYGGPSPVAPSYGGGGGGKATGQVKSFSEKNGYGFIVSPVYPGDIKFSKSDIFGGMSLPPGARVSFNLVSMPDGRVQAKQVSMGGGGGGGGTKRAASAMSSPFGGLAGLAGLGNPLAALAAMAAGGSFNMRPAKQMRTSPPVVQKAQSVGTPTGQYATGTIKSFNAQKGFGFITSPAVAGDVFFMRSSLPPEAMSVPLENLSVSFEIAYTAEGKARAQSVTLA